MKYLMIDWLKASLNKCLMQNFTAGSIPKNPLFRPDGKIVGGSPAEIENFPYQLSLQYYEMHMCGASVISDRWAVTAAHCVNGVSASQSTIRAGSKINTSGGTMHAVKQLIYHPLFNSQSRDYDIGLIEVSEPFAFGTTVQPINLPSQGESVPTGTSSIVSGWGATAEDGYSSNELLQVAVPVVSNEECNAAYSSGITEHMLCAGATSGGKDACQGDSGGPLVAGQKLVGVVSWGSGCARPEYPRVYANVSSLRDWIRENSGV